MHRPGDWVEVLELPEILATLDGDGLLEGLPFMPEMAAFCGGRFQVRMRAERTCVHPPERRFRKLRDCVVLTGLRCTGASHGGCQLGCMIYWKESWLKKGEPPRSPLVPGRMEAGVLGATRRSDPDVYFCQGTELVRATSPGDPLWKPGQYVRFVSAGTFTIPELAAWVARIGARWVQRHVRARLPARGRHPAAPVVGSLDLVPGERVRVKTREAIAATLDERGRYRGLAFGGEMERFCGRTMIVAARVDRIMDEATGRIRLLKDTVILDGGICDRHWGCARGMPILWREAWLERVVGS